MKQRQRKPGKKRRAQQQTLGLCYLCGKLLLGKVNRDHIPPKQIFSHPDRKEQNLSQLERRQTHESCNQSYQEDEKYFTDWMATISHQINPISDVLRRNEEAENRGKPKRKFIKEVEEVAKAPIYSPERYILMTAQEPEKIKRATWKIIRGLYFIEHQDKIILPQNTEHSFIGPITTRNQRLLTPSQFEPEQLIAIYNLLSTLDNRPSMGKYPEIFDYDYNSMSVSQTPQLRKYTWVLTLHGSVIIAVTFEAS